MSAWNWFQLTWVVVGFIGGLYAANTAYGDESFETDRGITAAAAFGAVLIFLPVVIIGIVGYFFLKSSAWLLLPAYRREQRAKRKRQIYAEEMKKVNEIHRLRIQIDRLHNQMGIPEVDWSGDVDGV